MLQATPIVLVIFEMQMPRYKIITYIFNKFESLAASVI